MKQRWVKRRELQQLLTDRTKCVVQHTGWACNTCFHAMKLVGVNENDLHAMWQATLVLRGDYKNGQYGIDMPDARLSAVVERLLKVLRRH